MAVDHEDEKMLEAIVASRARLDSIEVSDMTRGWIEDAAGLLDTAHEGFAALVEREDVEEIEAHEALVDFRTTRDELDRCFQDVLSALDIHLGEQRLAHQATPEKVGELAHFLNRFHGGEYEVMRSRPALRAAKHAIALARHADAATHEAEALGRAVERAQQARKAAGVEGAEAVQAYAELVEGRTLARVCYLTARDLVSAALRFDDTHDDLDAIITPIADVLKVGFD